MEGMGGYRAPMGYAWGGIGHEGRVIGLSDDDMHALYPPHTRVIGLSDGDNSYWTRLHRSLDRASGRVSMKVSFRPPRWWPPQQRTWRCSIWPTSMNASAYDHIWV